MKILVIHGSPHKGNTLNLTYKFEDAMKKYGDVIFEYLSVNELNLEMCRGCFNCITKGEYLCPIKNDDFTSPSSFSFQSRKSKVCVILLNRKAIDNRFPLMSFKIRCAVEIPNE